MQEADRGSTWEGDEREERERRRATAAAKKCRGWVESLVEPAAGGSARRKRERERGVADSLAVKYGVKGSIIDYTDFLCRKKP